MGPQVALLSGLNLYTSQSTRLMRTNVWSEVLRGIPCTYIYVCMRTPGDGKGPQNIAFGTKNPQS